MALGVGVPIPTIATAGIRIVPDLTGFQSLVRAGGIDAATVGGGAATAALTAATGAVIAFGAASVAAAAKASTAFVDYEDSLIKIQTLTGTSAEVTEEWGDRILDLAPEVGRGPQELADALFFVASAGVEGEAAFQALEASARGAALGLGDTEQVADAVTSALGAYGQNALTAAEATDILAATVDRGKVEADALAGSIGRVIPIAAAAGVEFAEVGAAVAALSRTGLDADEATTALRQLLNNLINPSRESADALASVGLEAQEVRDLLEQDLLATLELLRERFDGNTEGLFNLIPNIRAVTGFLSLMGENADSTRDIFDDLANSAGFVDERFAILEQSNAFRRDQARAAIEAAFIGEGEASAESITELLEIVADVLPQIIPDLVNVGEAVIDIAGGFAEFASGLVDIRNELKEPLGSQETVGGFLAKLIFGDLGNNAAVVRGDLDAIRARTDLLDRYVEGIGDVAITNNFDEAQRRLAATSVALDDLFNRPRDESRQSILEGFDEGIAIPFQQGATSGPAASAAREFFDESIDSFNDLKTSIRGVVEETSNYGGVVSNLRGPSGQVIDGWGTLKATIDGAAEGVSDYGDELLAVTDPGFRAIKAVEDLESAYNDAFADGIITDEEAASLVQPFLAANAALEELDPADVTNFRETVGPVLAELGTDFDAVFGDGGVVPVSFGEFGEATATAFGDDGPVLSNIRGWGTSTFGPAVATELDTALSVVKGRLGIDSPSSVWAAEVGLPIAQGVAAGFRQGIPDIVAAFGELPTPAGVGGASYGGDTIVVVNPREESIASGVQRAGALSRIATS